MLGPLYQGIDATAGMIMFDDGAIYHLNISWALPVTWPGAVYSLEVGIVGTDGVLTIDDTHRDMVLAVSKPQAEGYAPDKAAWSISSAAIRRATWRSANCAARCARKPNSWLNRVSLGLPTQAATAARGAQPADADQGARSFGEAQAAGQAAARAGTRAGGSVIRILLALFVLISRPRRFTRSRMRPRSSRARRSALVVGIGVGSGYDINARPLARHIGAHIPGNPTIIVQNQPGAGSLTMTNALYNNGPFDGTVIGASFNGMPTTPLLQPRGARFDADQAELARQHQPRDPGDLCLAHRAGADARRRQDHRD